MAAALMPDQKTMGRTLTQQASGPHVLLSRLSERLSEQRHKQMGEDDDDREVRDSQIYGSWSVTVIPDWRHSRVQESICFKR